MKKRFVLFLALSFSVLCGPKLSAQETQETGYESAKEFYFQLEDFVEPKVYFYENTKYPELSYYWRISSIPDSNILLTESFLLDLEQVESFKEQYDSIGSKVVEYIKINNSDSILMKINESEVYRWNSNEEYKYSVRESRSGLSRGFDKSRQYQASNSMEILGETIEVLRFKDGYTFYNGFVQHSRQQTFYSKEYGMVRFVRFDESTKESETYILRAIYSEEEWEDLQN